MTQWEDALRHLANNVENHFDNLRQRLERRFNTGPIVIQPYLGYGSRHMIRLHGRVMQDNGITEANERDTVWDNLLNTYRRFASQEIPYAVIRAQVADSEMLVTADEEGFFTLEIKPELALPDTEILQHVALELMEVPGLAKPRNAVQVTGYAIVPAANAEYGIISDLDDTVIQSNVLSFIKLAKNTFLQNAQTRLPFSGVAAFYRALKQGTRSAPNPIFYVSNSPWNLYDLLTDFLELKEIPPGPLFLQDIGLTRDQWITAPHHLHKTRAIEEILEMNPSLPFVLIGDSTEHDAEIYFQIASANPQRVKVIYIRDINASQSQRDEIAKLAHELEEYKVPMLLVEDTTEAAVSAIGLGLISSDALPEIKGETKHDEEKPGLIEQVVDELKPD